MSPSFCFAVFAMALVTAQDGREISCSMGSGGCFIQGMLVKSGFTTTLSPAKSLSNSK